MVELRPRPGAFAVTPRKLDSRSLINRELEGRDFRDQLIAASLKPTTSGALSLRGANFRDQLIAASLKPDDRRVLAANCADFRDQLIAASLKLRATHRTDLAFVISAIN